VRLLALTVLTTFGCGPPPPDDHVVLEHLELCWTGCPSASSAVRGDRIAAGARYVVWVPNAPGLPPFTVSTSDDSVLSIASATSSEGDAEHPDTVMLEARAPGSARLIFNELGGELIDAAEISVVEAATLAHFERPEQPLRLMLGGSNLFYLETHDAAGQRLLGYGAIEYTTSDGATVQDTRAQATVLDAGWGRAIAWPESVRVTADSVGLATIQADAGDASLTFDVEVVDSSAVSRIQLTTPFSIFAPAHETQEAHAFTADGDEIHDPECEWTWSSDVPDWSVNAGRNTISLTTDQDVGSVEVTCTIGEITASTWL